MGTSAKQDLLAEEIRARIELARAQRVAALWLKPALSDEEIAEACGLAVSTWQVMKRAGDNPRLFNQGRRVFALTTHVREWLEAKALEQPYAPQKARQRA